MAEEKEKSIGSLWIKGIEDRRFYAGVIRIDGKEHDIVIFKNKYIKDGKSPDYIIFKGKGKKQ